MAVVLHSHCNYKMANIRIASWNVNSIRARFNVLSKWLKKNQYDVVFIQETKVQDHEFPIDDIKNIGYEVIFLGQKSYNGVAILSKEKINVINKSLPGDQKDDQARFLTSKVKDIELICIYLPNGNPIDTDKFPYKLKWMDRLTNYIKKNLNENKKFILAGDFNVIPKEIDVHNPEAWTNDALFHEDTLKKFWSMMNLGLTDAYRAINGDKVEYTFFDYKRKTNFENNKGLRIDHFLLPPSMVDKLDNCYIDSKLRGLEKPSDHVPIVCEFKL